MGDVAANIAVVVLIGLLVLFVLSGLPDSWVWVFWCFVALALILLAFAATVPFK